MSTYNKYGKNKLKQSTIKKYNVLQICKHLNQFQLDHNIREYRFDFNFNCVFKKESTLNGLDYYGFIGNIQEYNRESILYILNDIYTTDKRI